MSKENMKKWKLVLLVLLILAVVIGFTGDAHAAVDEYGNEIDWDVNGSGNEDGAGGEENYVPIDADILEQEREVQSEEEMESLAALLESLGEEDNSVLSTGIVVVKFQAEESWRGSNVSLIAYDQNMKKHEIYLYKQNGFEAKEELPCGVYTIYEARAVGDRKGLYPMMADMDKFEVTEGGQAVVVNIALAAQIETKPETKPEQEQETEAIDIKDKVETEERVGMNRVIKANMVFIVAGILGAVGYLVFRRKRGEKDGDIHNDW